MTVNEALVNNAIRRVTVRDGLAGSIGTFRGAVNKQIRLELGFLFWLQVALLVYRLVKIFWNSPEAIKMRRKK
jgi:hypothetical protein